MSPRKTRQATKMEELLNKNKPETEELENIEVKITEKNKVKQSKKLNKTEINIPRGKPKSGRIWKNEKTRFSSVVKTRGIRDRFEKKQTLRTDLKRVKDASRAIIQAKKDDAEMKKQRRRENLKRREENRIKSEVVQVIKNPSKIKKMKKKQLRFIEKRDTTNM